VLDTLSYYNVPVNARRGDRHNPWRTLRAVRTRTICLEAAQATIGKGTIRQPSLIRQVATPDDFVVIKLDIDTIEIESALHASHTQRTPSHCIRSTLLTPVACALCVRGVWGTQVGSRRAAVRSHAGRCCAALARGRPRLTHSACALDSVRAHFSSWRALHVCGTALCGRLTGGRFLLRTSRGGISDGQGVATELCCLPCAWSSHADEWRQCAWFAWFAWLAWRGRGARKGAAHAADPQRQLRALSPAERGGRTRALVGLTRLSPPLGGFPVPRDASFSKIGPRGGEADELTASVFP
jgi:hypothetical protein